MSYYPLMVLLSDHTTLTLDTLAERFRKKFSIDPNVKVSVDHGNAESLLVSCGKYEFNFSSENEPHVIIESQEIAETFAASHPESPQIANCRRRLCLSADDDPEMEHFNDYLFLMEVLESFPGVYLFDPQQGEFVSGSS